MRPKWDEPRGELTYGQRTVARAVGGASTMPPQGCDVGLSIAPHTPGRRPDLSRARTTFGDGLPRPAEAGPPTGLARGDGERNCRIASFLPHTDVGNAKRLVARLRGARMVQCNEFPEGGRLAENKLKQLTGGDTVVARFLYGEHFEFRPTHKLMVRTNHKPSIRGADWGIWRRVALVPFTVTVSEADRRPRDELLAKLQLHASGILRWMVEGCLAWQREGLRLPSAVRAATEEYRVESDMVGSFLAERTRPALAESIAARELYEAFTAWCEDTGEKACSNRAFGVKLSERGLVRGRSTGGLRTWEGIAIVSGPSK